MKFTPDDAPSGVMTLNGLKAFQAQTKIPASLYPATARVPQALQGGYMPAAATAPELLLIEDNLDRTAGEESREKRVIEALRNEGLSNEEIREQLKETPVPVLEQEIKDLNSRNVETRKEAEKALGLSSENTYHPYRNALRELSAFHSAEAPSPDIADFPDAPSPSTSKKEYADTVTLPTLIFA